MRIFRVVLIAVSILLVSTSAFALKIALSVEIHNSICEDAYDFHLKGTIKSSTQPTQLGASATPVPAGSIPGFDWTYGGGTIVNRAGQSHFWDYSGGWSGFCASSLQ